MNISTKYFAIAGLVLCSVFNVSLVYAASEYDAYCQQSAIDEEVPENEKQVYIQECIDDLTKYENEENKEDKK